MLFKSIIKLCVAALLMWPLGASAKQNLLFILDASNSMWGQIDGVAKIETAKKAFGNLVSDIPDSVNIGLAAYGHREKESCKDVDFLTAFVDKGNRNMLTDAVDKIVPKGKTPIAWALESTATVMQGQHKDANNEIVIISDGVETCKGDPCAVAEKLASGNTKFRVHVVGFDIAEKDRKQLECIAEKGNGKYFAANSTAGFSEALAQVAQAAVEPPPAPKPAAKAMEEIFRDNFDGDALAEHWEVVNPNDDSYIVEDGELMIVNGKYSALNAETLENTFVLNQEIPKGDWVMTMRVRMPLQTKQEEITIGLRDTFDKVIAAQIGITHYNPYSLSLTATKYNGKDEKFFRAHMFGHAFKEWNDVVNYAKTNMPFDIQLIKQGKKYWAKAVSAVDNKVIFETEKLTSLKAKGKLFVNLRQRYNVDGETNAHIDWVKIEAAASE